MAHVQSQSPRQPVVLNVADLLKPLQNAGHTRSQQNILISGRGPIVTGENSVVVSTSPCGSSTTCTPITHTVQRQESVSYNHKMKIINSSKKSDVIVRYLNNFTTRFDSVNALRLKLVEAFTDQVPNTVDFSVGYYEGSQQSKIWLVTSDDLQKMYETVKGEQITLWCDQRPTESEEPSRKRKRESDSTRREDKEEEVDREYMELLKKHKNEYTTPLLRLWARTIASDYHDDYDNLPDMPQFKSSSTSAPKKKRQE